MTVLRYLAPFIAFSFGAVAMRRSRSSTQVAPAEVAVLIAVLTVAFACRSWEPAAAVIGVSALGLLAGAICSRLVASKSPMLPAGTREFESREAAHTQKSLWRQYLAFSRRVADFQIRGVLVFAYLLVLAPIVLVARFAQKNEESSDSTWRSRAVADSLESARRPF